MAPNTETVKSKVLSSIPCEVAGVTLLKSQAPEALLRRPFIPGRDEIPGDVDSSNFCPETRQWHRRRCAFGEPA